MKIIAVNCSPRKKGNTQILLSKALEGAASKGADTELINLIDLNFKGCISCFGCRIKGSPNIGKCVCKDDLSPIIEDIMQCDGLVIGTPMYMDNVTGMARNFIERLCFPIVSYDGFEIRQREHNMPTAFFYTMNCPEHAMHKMYMDTFKKNEMMLTRFFAEQSKILYATETLPVDDFDKYHMSVFDVVARRDRNANVFPEVCQNAFDIGADMVISD